MARPGQVDVATPCHAGHAACRYRPAVSPQLYRYTPRALILRPFREERPDHDDDTTTTRGPAICRWPLRSCSRAQLNSHSPAASRPPPRPRTTDTGLRRCICTTLSWVTRTFCFFFFTCSLRANKSGACLGIHVYGASKRRAGRRDRAITRPRVVSKRALVWFTSIIGQCLFE